MSPEIEPASENREPGTPERQADGGEASVTRERNRRYAVPIVALPFALIGTIAAVAGINSIREFREEILKASTPLVKDLKSLQDRAFVDAMFIRSAALLVRDEDDSARFRVEITRHIDRICGVILDPTAPIGCFRNAITLLEWLPKELTDALPLESLERVSTGVGDFEDAPNRDNRQIELIAFFARRQVTAVGASVGSMIADSSRSPAVRKAAIEYAMETDERSTISALENLCASPPSELQWAALLALARIYPYSDCVTSAVDRAEQNSSLDTVVEAIYLIPELDNERWILNDFRINMIKRILERMFDRGFYYGRRETAGTPWSSEWEVSWGLANRSMERTSWSLPEDFLTSNVTQIVGIILRERAMSGDLPGVHAILSALDFRTGFYANLTEGGVVLVADGTRLDASNTRRPHEMARFLAMPSGRLGKMVRSLDETAGPSTEDYMPGHVYVKAGSDDVIAEWRDNEGRIRGAPIVGFENADAISFQASSHVMRIRSVTGLRRDREP